jgi:hypothetical protein
MLSQDLILIHLNRLGLDDYEATSFENDDDGDFVKAYFPDLDFKTLKERVLKTKYYLVYLDDQGINYFNFRITEMIEGFSTLYRLIIKKEPYGVSFSCHVKRIDFYNSFGAYKPALGYAMLKELIADDIDEEERFDLTGRIE